MFKSAISQLKILDNSDHRWQIALVPLIRPSRSWYCSITNGLLGLLSLLLTLSEFFKNLICFQFFCDIFKPTIHSSASSGRSLVFWISSLIYFSSSERSLLKSCIFWRIISKLTISSDLPAPRHSSAVSSGKTFNGDFVFWTRISPHSNCNCLFCFCILCTWAPSSLLTIIVSFWSFKQPSLRWRHRNHIAFI